MLHTYNHGLLSYMVSFANISLDSLWSNLVDVNTLPDSLAPRLHSKLAGLRCHTCQLTMLQTMASKSSHKWQCETLEVSKKVLQSLHLFSSLNYILCQFFLTLFLFQSKRKTKGNDKAKEFFKQPMPSLSTHGAQWAERMGTSRQRGTLNTSVKLANSILIRRKPSILDDVLSMYFQFLMNIPPIPQDSSAS